MDTTRIGVISSLENEPFFKKTLSNFSNIILTNLQVSLTEQFIAWRQTNTNIVVLDDSLFVGNDDLEDELITYAKEANFPAIRFILYSDQVRDQEDAFFYRLVSEVEVKDILFTGFSGEPEKDLIKKIKTPTSFAEVSSWKTNNPKLLERKKPGFFSKFSKDKPKKDKSRKMKRNKKTEDFRNANDEDVSTEATTAFPVIESEEIKTEDNNEVLPENKTALETMDTSESENIIKEETQEDNVTVDEDFDYYAQLKKEQNPQVNIDQEFQETNDSPDKENEIISQPESAFSPDTLTKSELNTVTKFQEDTTLDEIIAIPKSVKPAYSPNDLLGAKEYIPKLPRAHTTIAISGIRSGIGCTHLAISLGSALASQDLCVSVALHDRATFNRMKDALSDAEKIGKGFKWHNCDIFYWFDQAEYADKYDYVVCDCDVVDFSDSSPHSPVKVFRTAQLKAFILSGAPWDLSLVSNVMNTFNTAELSTWKFCFYSSEKPTTEAIETGLKELLYKEDLEDFFLIPHRYDLFTGEKDFSFTRYSKLLKSVVSAEICDKARQEKDAYIKTKNKMKNKGDTKMAS